MLVKNGSLLPAYAPRALDTGGLDTQGLKDLYGITTAPGSNSPLITQTFEYSTFTKTSQDAFLVKGCTRKVLQALVRSCASEAESDTRKDLWRLIDRQQSHSIAIPLWHEQTDEEEEQLYYVINGITKEMPRDSYGIDSFLISSKVKQGGPPSIESLFTGLRILGFMWKHGNKLNDDYVKKMQILVEPYNNQEYTSFKIQRGVNGWYLSAKRPVPEEKLRPEALSALFFLVDSMKTLEYAPEFYW